MLKIEIKFYELETTVQIFCLCRRLTDAVTMMMYVVALSADGPTEVGGTGDYFFSILSRLRRGTRGSVFPVVKPRSRRKVFGCC